MNSVVAAFPDRELHVILDNLNTHRRMSAGSGNIPASNFHFTPTRSSWLNQVRNMVFDSAGPVTNGASFTAVEQLPEHIDAFIAAYNETAEPFAWTKKKSTSGGSKITVSLNSDSGNVPADVELEGAALLALCR